MEKQIAQAFENDVPNAVSGAPTERPRGVVWAAVLIIVGSLLGLIVRLTVVPLAAESAGWIALHLFSFVVAWGLWRLQRWTYWLFLGLVVVGMGQNLWRLFIMPEALGVVYPILRLAVLGFWVWYFRRPHVRRAFGLVSQKNH